LISSHGFFSSHEAIETIFHPSLDGMMTSMMDELQYDSTAQENQRKNMEQQIPGLVISYSLLLKLAIEIVDLPIYLWWIFP